MSERLFVTRAMPTGLRCGICGAPTIKDDGTHTQGCVSTEEGAAHQLGGVLIAAATPPTKCEECERDAVPGEEWCSVHLAALDADTADETDGSAVNDSTVQGVRELADDDSSLLDVRSHTGGDGS